jgi:hypothetical protein
MRKTMHSILGLATILATSSGAHAQVMLDLTKVTCDRSVRQVANPKFIAMWLGGYFHGKGKMNLVELVFMSRPTC